MELQKINKLLEKYWQAETSEAEEKVLFEYFNQKEIDPSLKPYQPLFIHQKVSSNRKLSGNFNEKILLEIHKKEQKKNRKTKWLTYYLQTAAVITLLIISTIWLLPDYSTKKYKNKSNSQVEIEDPNKAYETAKEALILVSTQINRGKIYAANIKKVQEAEEKLEDNLKIEL